MSLSEADLKRIDREVIGWMSEEELCKLNELATQSVNRNALEIGSFCGRSSCAIGLGMRDIGGSLTCVDLFNTNIGHTDWKTKMRTTVPDTHKSFKEAIDKFNLKETVVSIKGNTRHILPNLWGSYGFIFIDGSHYPENLMLDAYWAKKHLADGGVIAFHDYENEIWVEVKPVIDMLRILWQGEWSFCGQLAVYQS